MVAVFSYAVVQTLVVPALGLLQRELHTTSTWSAWILSAFLLSSAVLTPLISWLGDQYDKRRVMLGALAVFFCGCVGATAVSNIGEMIAARVAQGAGLSLLPLSIAVIREVLPAERTHAAMGAVSGVIGAGAGLGLVIGGLVADSLSWRYLFAVGAALIALSFLLVASWVPSGTGHLRRPFDPVGAVLLATALSVLLVALTEGPAWGWDSAWVLGLFAATAVILAALAVAETRMSDPLIDMRELVHRPTLMTHSGAFIFGLMSFIFYVTLPAYEETPRAAAGYGFTASVTESGLMLLPGAVTLLIAGAVTARLAAKLGPRWPAAAGFALAAAGSLALLVAHTAIWEHAVWYAVIGAGSGLIVASMPLLLVRVVPPQRTSVTNGINNIFRTVGGVVGTQVAAAVLASGKLSSGIPAASSYSTLFATAAVVCLVGVGVALLAVTSLQRGAPADVVAPDRADSQPARH